MLLLRAIYGPRRHQNMKSPFGESLMGSNLDINCRREHLSTVTWPPGSPGFLQACTAFSHPNGTAPAVPVLSLAGLALAAEAVCWVQASPMDWCDNCACLTPSRGLQLLASYPPTTHPSCSCHTPFLNKAAPHGLDQKYRRSGRSLHSAIW